MKWIGLAILALIAILGAISQTLPSILVEPSKAALGMTDTTIGLINGFGVSLIGAMAAFPIGWAADRYGRRLVLGVSVVVWSAFVLVTGLATSVTVFAVGAMGINLGDAALLPLLYAMIAATFTGQARNTANGLFVAVLLLGSFGDVSRIRPDARHIRRLGSVSIQLGLTFARLTCLRGLCATTRMRCDRKRASVPACACPRSQPRFHLGRERGAPWREKRVGIGRRGRVCSES